MKFWKVKRLIAGLSVVMLYCQVAPAATIDWSRELVDSTIKRYPTAESLKGWGYAKSLYLYGQYLVYLRTKDKRYLDHIQAWIDRVVHIDGARVGTVAKYRQGIVEFLICLHRRQRGGFA